MIRFRIFKSNKIFLRYERSHSQAMTIYYVNTLVQIILLNKGCLNQEIVNAVAAWPNHCAI